MNITRIIPSHLQEEYDRIIRELKRTRQRKGVSQTNIAERCGISFTTVSAIERGIQICSTTTLIGYLQALHLTYSDLETSQEAEEDPISPKVRERIGTLTYDQQELLMDIPSGLVNLMEQMSEDQQQDLAKIRPELLKRLVKMSEEQQEKLMTVLDIILSN